MQAPLELSDANFKASRFYVLKATSPCPHCGFQTQVYALALPEAHQWLHMDDEDGRATWQSASAPAVLLHVEAMSSAAALRLRHLAPGFRPCTAPSSGVSRWTNHCDRCSEPLADDDLHCEPETAFMPISAAAAQLIRLTDIHQPVEVIAPDCTLDAIWLAQVTRG